MNKTTLKELSVNELPWRLYPAFEALRAKVGTIRSWSPPSSHNFPVAVLAQFQQATEPLRDALLAQLNAQKLNVPKIHFPHIELPPR